MKFKEEFTFGLGLKRWRQQTIYYNWVSFELFLTDNKQPELEKRQWVYLDNIWNLPQLTILYVLSE